MIGVRGHGSDLEGARAASADGVDLGLAAPGAVDEEVALDRLVLPRERGLALELFRCGLRSAVAEAAQCLLFPRFEGTVSAGFPGAKSETSRKKGRVRWGIICEICGRKKIESFASG